MSNGSSDDIAIVDVEWRIDLARHGDGEQLANLLRSDDPVSPMVRKFLAAVVTGEIELQRPLPEARTYSGRSQKWLREKAVSRMVDFEMQSFGKQRDRNLRTYLTRKWCEVHGTTPNRVADYIRYGQTKAKRSTKLDKIAALRR